MKAYDSYYHYIKIQTIAITQIYKYRTRELYVLAAFYMTIGNIFQPTPASLIRLLDTGQMSPRQVASLTLSSNSSILMHCRVVKYMRRRTRQEVKCANEFIQNLRITECSFLNRKKQGCKVLLTE